MGINNRGTSVMETTSPLWPVDIYIPAGILGIIVLLKNRDKALKHVVILSKVKPK